jgi:hypothetical protein
LPAEVDEKGWLHELDGKSCGVKVHPLTIVIVKKTITIVEKEWSMSEGKTQISIFFCLYENSVFWISTHPYRYSII